MRKGRIWVWMAEIHGGGIEPFGNAKVHKSSVR
jgi:hypothetical protein